MVADEELYALFHQVMKRWASAGVLGPPNAEDAIAAAERRVGRLHGSYKQFLRCAGVQLDDDQSSVLFWRPGDLRPAEDVLRDCGREVSFENPAVVIADYMQESWWYVLWLAGVHTGCVSLVLGGDPHDLQPPMGSFVDFLSAYLEDAPEMYPPRR
jgi:hypothetical protein